MSDVEWSLMLWGALGCSAWMFALWLVQLRTRNAGIVDFGWAASLGSLGVYYALVADGAPAHRVLVGLGAGIWGWRLALHLLRDRILGRPEEGRYVTLRANWSPHADRFFLVFFQAQAGLAIILSLPFLLAVSRRSQELGFVELIGAAMWILGMAGESIADAQLARFKADPENRGRVCQVGLWAYSRHPNYFFEWVIWLGFAGLGLTAPMGWLGLLAPAMILGFILKITGIPPTEAQALKSRGEAYREYQETTSAFVPWFRKEGKA